MIVLGRVAAPFGVAGWLKVHPFGDDPLSWRSMSQWWLAESPDAAAESWVVVKQVACKAHGDGIVVLFEGVEDRNRAEALRGWFIGAPRSALPKTAKDEYYWIDLMGLPVMNVEGEALGKVIDLIESGANTVLQLRDDEGTERLLPFTEQVIRKVRLSQGIEVVWGRDWGLD